MYVCMWHVQYASSDVQMVTNNVRTYVDILVCNREVICLDT